MKIEGSVGIRRSQVIAPFGVGALTVTPDGISIICGGLDNWFRDIQNLESSEYCIREWRLEELLGVEHFMYPPDYRDKKRSLPTENVEITIPAWRFPLWHWCQICKSLRKATPSRKAILECDYCIAKHGSKNVMVQVRFVAMCRNGHMQDFPWHGWVHKDESSKCAKPLFLKGSGGLGLGSLKVECGCGAKRSLGNIMTAKRNDDIEETYLSTELNSDDRIYTCKGEKPWFGNAEPDECEQQLRATLRNASNVYFADIRGAIYLPKGGELESLVERLTQSQTLQICIQTGDSKKYLITKEADELKRKYSNDQILRAIEMLDNQTVTEATDKSFEEKLEKLKESEYNALRQQQNTSEALTIEPAYLDEYNSEIFGVDHYFNKICLVKRLRETRVLTGFSRVFPENKELDLVLKKKLLHNKTDSNSNWLPAIVVHGEGIYLEVNKERLESWERENQTVIERARKLDTIYKNLVLERRLENDKDITPRLLLVHTLAHILINQLTFDCGYSSASLKERIYVSESQGDKPGMAGLLIYTAAGDSEGTLGGLVQMGKPGFLEKVLKSALDNAKWCSADPICMELGASGGQGPDSCNGAACHSCALVPETSCEFFNRFLDRGLLIGDPENNIVGFFE